MFTTTVTNTISPREYLYIASASSTSVGKLHFSEARWVNYGNNPLFEWLQVGKGYLKKEAPYIPQYKHDI